LQVVASGGFNEADVEFVLDVVDAHPGVPAGREFACNPQEKQAAEVGVGPLELFAERSVDPNRVPDPDDGQWGETVMETVRGTVRTIRGRTLR
jgi:hypothetical protein